MSREQQQLGLSRKRAGGTMVVNPKEIQFRVESFTTLPCRPLSGPIRNAQGKTSTARESDPNENTSLIDKHLTNSVSEFSGRCAKNFVPIDGLLQLLSDDELS